MTSADDSPATVTGPGNEGRKFWMTSCDHVLCSRHDRKLTQSMTARKGKSLTIRRGRKMYNVRQDWDYRVYPQQEREFTISLARRCLLMR